MHVFNKIIKQGKGNGGRQLLSAVLLFALLTGEIAFLFTFWKPAVSAAEAPIDATTSTVAADHAITGSASVFVSDQVGYKFYTNSNGTCQYAKTTDGGASWDMPVTFDSQTDCFSPVIWYDQWTPGDTGTYIHIVSIDSGDDALWYNRLDTTDDSLLVTSSVNVTGGLNYTGTFTSDTVTPAITKGTDGTVYMGISNSAESIIVECSSECDVSESWSETGTTPLDEQDDFILMLPQANGDIMLIRRDVSASEIQYQIWDNSSWPGPANWSVIDHNATRNDNYDALFAAAVDDTFTVYLAYIDAANYAVADHDIRTAKYADGAWSSTDDVTTNDAKGLTGVAIALDKNTGDVYVAFTGRAEIATSTSANVYWVTASSTMDNWSSQQGPVNSTPDDIYGLDINHRSNERIYVSWYSHSTESLLGDTLADISPQTIISTLGTQISNISAGTADQYIGGAFVIQEHYASRFVNGIAITETGTVNGATDISNIALYYDLDTAAPYDCTSESFSGEESQFGVTDSDGFSAANGVSQFTDTVTISPTQALCVYVVLNVLQSAPDGSTLEIAIVDPATDVTLSSGAAAQPNETVSLPGTSHISNANLTQLHYHWRTDNGTEANALSSVGVEDTPLLDFARETPIRLRLQVANLGATSSVPTAFRLEYGIKIATCEVVAVWKDVGADNDAWDMYDSPHLGDGEDTTDITGAGFGAVTNPDSSTFVAANGGVRDLTSQTDALTLAEAQFVELEYSLTSTASTSYNTDYCFRVTNAGTPLPAYSEYAELTTAPKRDFHVQRGTTVVTGLDATVTPGPTSYTAPASTSLAFVRVTNMHHTGAGSTAADEAQPADQVTVYISDASDLTAGFTLSRADDSADTVVSWEIVEFIGELGTDNEVRVRDVNTISFGSDATAATGTPVSSVADDTDVAVFITGVSNSSDTATAYQSGQVTASWQDDTNQPVFTRIGAEASVTVSYAVVEFTGQNWRVQRIEHAYTAADTIETESITPINNLTLAFLHTQKRVGGNAEASFGHEVWLSSIGALSFRLSPNADAASGQVSVAWVIENTQTSEGRMLVQQKGASITGGIAPRTTSIPITKIDAMNNTSLFGMSAFAEDNTNFPHVLGGLTLASTTAFEIFNSNIVSTTPYFYRVEAVQWPTTGLSIRQNYYRWYVNNDELDPTDPWPAGENDVGENTSITAVDEPIGDSESVRLRLSLQVTNAPVAAGLRTFKLQYGPRSTTCEAIETWSDVGDIDSDAIWRGYNTSLTDGVELATSTPAPGTLNLSVSDVAGRLVEENPSAANPFTISDGEDVEYDFVLQHNGAAGSTFYCFRVVQSDSTPLDGYFHYPQIRTAGFTPVSIDWRWYADTSSETPTEPLADENVAATNIANATTTTLRLAIDEIKNVVGTDVKFKLQYSEHPNFADGGHDVAATSSCTAGSIWCYADGGGTNNALISTAVLSATDLCIDGVGAGCGTHNEDATYVTGDTHEANAIREYQFVLQQAGARVGAVYYFRAYDLRNNAPVTASSTYPSLVAASSELTFATISLPAGTVTEGVVTNVATASSSISFGTLSFDTDYTAAYRLNINTNATEGYQVFMRADQPLQNSYGEEIPTITGTNGSPTAWADGCEGLPGCFGYHVGDDSLSDGSARFGIDDSYAAISDSVAEEVAYSSVPGNESHDIVYRISVTEEQEAGDYSTGLMFIVVPVY